MIYISKTKSLLTAKYFETLEISAVGFEMTNQYWMYNLNTNIQQQKVGLIWKNLLNAEIISYLNRDKYVDQNANLISTQLILSDIDPDWKHKANETLLHHKESKLNFDYDDIKYIFVKDDRMARKLIRDIGPIIDGKSHSHLISKIFITSQVFDDL